MITAAGRNQHTIPLQRLVDRDGTDKSALQIILEEVLGAGIEEVAIVIAPGDAPAFKEAAGPHAGRITFVEQSHPRGYGDAVARTSSFTARDPFLHLVGDHLYVARGEMRCAEQLVRAATAHQCAVSAVQPTRESQLAYYGAVGGRRVPQQPRLYEIETVLEKPTPTQAEQTLLVPGLRAGHYLCYFGMHVLTPAVMDLLAGQAAAAGASGDISLSTALAELARREKYLALEIAGARYNIGEKYGILWAQLALAMAGKDREEVLAQMVELLAVKC